MISIALTGDNRETVKIIKTKVENVKTTNQTIFYFNRGAVLYKDNEVENVEAGHSIVWATEYTELTMEGENIFKNNTISTNNSIFMLYANTTKVFNKWELIFDQNKTAADILELRYYNEFNNTGHIKFINENQANKIFEIKELSEGTIIFAGSLTMTDNKAEKILMIDGNLNLEIGGSVEISKNIVVTENEDGTVIKTNNESAKTQ